MPKRLSRLIEIRILDESGRRVEGARLTVFANDAKIAVIPATRDRDPSIQVSGRNIVVSVQIEFLKFLDGVTLAQDQNEWIFTIPSKYFPPAIFIGCSTEGLREAMIIQKGLAPFADTAIWSQGVFDLTRGTLETLLENARRFTHAVLILTPDDTILKRAAEVTAARDNVLFELGLFMGALGSNKTYFVTEKAVRLPTDLAGVTTAIFERGKGINIEANMGPIVTTLLRRMGLL